MPWRHQRNAVKQYWLNGWVIFDRCNFGRYIIFNTFEIDDSIKALVSAAFVTNRQPSLCVSSSFAFQTDGKTFLGFVLVISSKVIIVICLLLGS
jgi:hypothetical protein